MSTLLESWLPRLVGVTAFLAAAVCPRLPPAQAILSTLFQAIVTVGAIGVGFLSTAQSILVSVADRRQIKSLKASGHLDRLVSFLQEAIHTSFALCILSTIGLLVELNTLGLGHCLFALWVGLMAWAVAACFRVIHLLGKILRM